MLNFAALQSARLHQEPYPYIVVTNALNNAKLDLAIKDFPQLQSPGSVPISQTRSGPGFEALVQELEGEEFRSLIASKLDLDLADCPVMTTVRGVMREKDGRIHTDSRTKVVTVLLYLNKEWNQRDGCLRILRNGKNIEDYVEEIPPLAGTMVIFEVTDNCWHGHTPVTGKRLSIQLNYVTSAAAHGKHRFFHNISARLKKLRSGSI